MLRLGEHPLIAYSVSWLARQGVDRIFVNLHHHPEQIEAYLGDGSAFGVRVSYHYEPELLGTAGTVRALEPWFDGEDVLVAYGDLLIEQSLDELFTQHAATAADATLLVHRRRGSNSVLALADDRRVLAFQERPDNAPDEETWVNSGVQLLSPAARVLIGDTVPADLPRDLYVPHLSALRIFAVPVTGYRCAIDSPKRYEQATAAVRDGIVPTPLIA